MVNTAAFNAVRDASHVHSAAVFSNDDTLMTPGLDQQLTDLTPLSDIDARDPIAAVRAPLPGYATQPTVATPGEQFVPQPSLDTIVGANLLPQTPPASNVDLKAGPGLRLPSFQKLGIANPHPDSPGPDTCVVVGSTIPRQRLSDPVPPSMASSLGGMRLETLSDCSNPLTRALSLDAEGDLPLPIQRRPQLIETLTPPEDKSAVLWNSLSNPEQPYTNPSSFAEGRSQPAVPTLSDRAESSRQPLQSTAAPPRIELQRTQSDYNRMPFVDDAASRILTNIRTSEQTTSSSLRVLSHALPCPSPSGFAFPAVISALQVNTPGSPLCWINVFHALRKSNLAELPTSPPSTPGQPGGGNDYFTSKTFDSAVPIIDYQDNLTSDLPKSPLPVVAPSSMNVSIVERYIPPTNANEFAEMFELNGRSLLVDRLMELSPDNGTLLFIYPTLAGGQTFKREYLGPILDPILRMMRTIHNLPIDLVSSLGNMSAVNSMLDFATLHAKLQQLCESLSKQNSLMQRISRRQGLFTLEHASQEKVKIERNVWADNWWIKQEKPRIRETVNNLFGKGAQTSEITPMSMTNTLLNEVSRKQYPAGLEPVNGIELGVFVIKRTA
ncbi:hypothetical protein C1H76_5961 [Elsinoe australis]|uniref:Uncharacterized protein n=1 Tax=Elsinoe australis TaxID=40998 RepID=A0A4U7AZJ3_9PEZI|nr:hypothetical protein C1H76_5961 [Elsinoe australis]